jgi:peptidoglycan/xylan/chitin deacetylase (PgdA/CDA1 family)
MLKRLQVVWPQTAILILSTVVGTAIASRLLPINGLFGQTISPSTNQQIQGTNTNPQVDIENPASWPTDPGLSQTINQWEQEIQSQMLNWPSPKRFQGKIFKEVKLKDNRKVFALTFDDGPQLHTTAQILDILKKNQVKGTFFIIGRNLKAYPQVGQRIVAEGHAIANHTWSHRYQKFSGAGAAREIDDTTALIYKITGMRTDLFRPPGGFLHNGPAGYAKGKNYAVVMWSADSNDWKRLSVHSLVNNIVNQAGPGGIALMHDGGGDRSATVKALPYIIANLKKRGYEFVTVPELLDLAERQNRAQPAVKSKPKPALKQTKPKKK